MVALIVVAVVVVFALFVASRAVRVIPQAKAGVVERLGRYSRTLEPGLNLSFRDALMLMIIQSDNTGP